MVAKDNLRGSPSAQTSVITSSVFSSGLNCSVCGTGHKLGCRSLRSDILEILSVICMAMVEGNLSISESQRSTVMHTSGEVLRVWPEVGPGQSLKASWGLGHTDRPGQVGCASVGF